MIDLYTKITSLKNNTNFEFMFDTIKTYELLHAVIEQYNTKISDNTALENSVFTRNGTEKYLTDKEWNSLYMLLMKNKRTKDQYDYNIILENLKKVVPQPISKT